MNYEQGLLKNSRLSESQLCKLTRAVLLSVQQDLFATEGKAFHLLEGIVRVQEDGTYLFTPNNCLKKLIEEQEYPTVLKIEEMRLLKWVVAILENRDE